MEALYRSILEIDPARHPTRLLLGELLRKQGRLDESAAELRGLVAERPGDAGAYYQLALTLEAARKPAEAEIVYREHLRIAPNDSVRARLAELLRRQGKGSEADALLRGAPGDDANRNP